MKNEFFSCWVVKTNETNEQIRGREPEFFMQIEEISSDLSIICKLATNITSCETSSLSFISSDQVHELIAEPYLKNDSMVITFNSETKYSFDEFYPTNGKDCHFRFSKKIEEDKPKLILPLSYK